MCDTSARAAVDKATQEVDEWRGKAGGEEHEEGAEEEIQSHPDVCVTDSSDDAEKMPS